jgi:hypothetical protein
MTTGASRVTDLNSYFANLYEDAVFAVRDSGLAPRLVTVFRDGQGDQTRTLSEYPEISFQTVAETEDYSNPTRMTKTALSTLTPGEVAAQTLITDRRIETDPDNARADAATELGLAASKKIDTDIFGNFSSLTGGTVGASGSACNWGYFFAGIDILRANNVPGPYVAVMHPYHWHYLAESAAVSATVTNAPEFQDEVMLRWWLQRAAGVDIFFSANCPTSGTDAYSAIFNPRALAFDLRRDFRLEPERDASARAWELTATMLYAHGVWRPLWGVQLIADAQTVS